MPISKQVMAVTLSLSLSFAPLAIQVLDAAGAVVVRPQGSQQSAPATTNAVPSADDLKSLVAPIALYPDNLVAQILAGSTYPTQVVDAERWLKQNKSLQGEQFAAAVDKQPWDESIKGLTQFPSVLENMSHNLSWTSSLGDAYFNVPDDVMSAIQSLRSSAETAGNLENTPQQTVVNEGDTIIIQPADPEVVYVPTYSPEVYGAYVPPSYPGYSGWNMVAASAISFGVGMAVGSAVGHPWGWGGWGTDWHGGNVEFNRNTYVSRSNTFVNRNTEYSKYRNSDNINRSNANRQQGDLNRQQGDLNRQQGNVNRPQQGNINRPQQGNQLTRPSGTSGQERLKTGGGPGQGNVSQDRQGAAQSRGFSGSTGTQSGSFSGYSQGGAARADSDRGRSSMGSSGGSRPSGGGGGGSRGGGGGGGGRGGGRR